MQNMDDTCKSDKSPSPGQIPRTVSIHPKGTTGSLDRTGLLRFGLFSSIYFLSYVQRVAVSVVADNLTFELGLDSVALGFISSGFFISYALAQLVMGFLCDKVGPERVSAGALIIAAIGSFMFASAKGFTLAFLGRIFMGAGLAAGFIPGMKVIASTFPLEATTTYSSLFLAIGNTGTLMGAAPLAYLITFAGWRPIFSGLAALAALLAILCWLFAKHQSEYTLQNLVTSNSPVNNTENNCKPAGNLSNLPSTYKEIILSPQLWLIALFLFAKYGSQTAFQGLWGIPYISSVYNVNATLAAQVITMIAIGYIITASFLGKLADDMAKRGTDLFYARKLLLVWTCIIYIASWIPIVFAPGVLPFGAMYVLLFIMGISVSSAGVAFIMTNDLVQPKILGLAMGLVNIMSIIGAASMPPVTGWFIKYFGTQGLKDIEIYPKALIPCFIASVLCLVLVSMIKNPIQKNLVPRKPSNKSGGAVTA